MQAMRNLSGCFANEPPAYHSAHRDGLKAFVDDVLQVVAESTHTNPFAAKWSRDGLTWQSGAACTPSNKLWSARAGLHLLDPLERSELCDHIRWCEEKLKLRPSSLTATLLCKVASIERDLNTKVLETAAVFDAVRQLPRSTDQQTLLNSLRPFGHDILPKQTVGKKLTVSLMKEAEAAKLYDSQVGQKFTRTLDCFHKCWELLHSLFLCSDQVVFRAIFAEGTQDVTADMCDGYDMCPVCYVILICCLHDRSNSKVACCSLREYTFNRINGVNFVPCKHMYSAQLLHKDVPPAECHCRLKMWRT
jgi:hypothetical protein